RGALGVGAPGRGRDAGQLDRCVDEVDPVVLLEVRVDGDALQAVLGVGVHRDLVDDPGDAGARVGEPDVTVAGGVQDTAVGQDRHVDRLPDVLGQGDLLVVRPV